VENHHLMHGKEGIGHRSFMSGCAREGRDEFIGGYEWTQGKIKIESVDGDIQHFLGYDREID